MNTSREPNTDKVGNALSAQRFQMLEGIAKELAGEVIFPTCFDAAFRLRKELKNPDLPISRIAKIVSGEPLVAAKLTNLANSVLDSRTAARRGICKVPSAACASPTCRRKSKSMRRKCRPYSPDRRLTEGLPHQVRRVLMPPNAKLPPWALASSTSQNISPTT